MSLAPEFLGDLPGTTAHRAPGDEGHRGSVALPTMSVVVASRGRGHLLRQFVGAVAGDPAATEVLIVLDGDVDGSYEVLSGLQREFPNVRPLTAQAGGQMAALELGVRSSTGDVVLMMDDDVIAGPGLVSAHAERHAGTKGLVVLGSMPIRLHSGTSSVTRLYAAEYEAHCEKLESGALEVLDGLWLGNVSARRGDLIRVGVRSDRFSVRWHADTDLGLRLREAGCRGVFDRRCQATHMHAQSAASFLRSAHERGEGTWLLRADHAERFSAVRPAPVFDGLSSPVRGLVSFLGREGRSGWSSRLLMSVAEGVERLGWNTVSARAAQLARRIQIACGFRCAERSGRSRPPANEARPADHDPWSTKSAR